MNRQALIPFALLAILALCACSDEPATSEKPAAPGDLEPGIALERIGTIGIHPAREKRLVVNADSAGRIVIEGEERTLDAIPEILKARADTDREEHDAKASRLFVVLRLDRTLPWAVANVLMAMCVDPSVRANRIHFAVLPERGDEEGSLATHLAREFSDRPRPDGPGRVHPITAALTMGGEETDLRALHARAGTLLEADPYHPCRVSADPRLPVGAVLRVIDVFHRAGARVVSCAGAPPPAGKRDMAHLLRLATERTGSPTITLLGETLPETTIPLPTVARIRGAFAGTTRPWRVGHVNVDCSPLVETLPSLDDPSPMELPHPETTSAHLPPNLPDPPRDGETDLDSEGIDRPEGTAVAGGPAVEMPRNRAHVRSELPGAGRARDDTIGRALDWLAKHQSPDGHWDCDAFSAFCRLNRCGGAGHASYDTGCTGLALLAFLAAGETHRNGRHRTVVRKGLRYLKSIQDPEGCFGSSTLLKSNYNHAIATLAMAEAYGITGSILFRRPTQRAVDYIERCRNPYLAWRYGVRPQDNDTSVTGWMILALTAAKNAGGIRVPKEAFEGARNWLDKITEPEYGKAGYTARGTGPCRPLERLDRFPPDRSEALTAIGMVTRMNLGERPGQSEMLAKGAELLMKALPIWDEASGSIDMVYWFFGTRALARFRGEPWAAWRISLKRAIVDSQRQDGDERGSWDPSGVWGHEGGRVYATAMMALCLMPPPDPP